jgi:ABC-type transport system involved in cytochrome bd biosynthesis fused ATPase/permease subunit
MLGRPNARVAHAAPVSDAIRFEAHPIEFLPGERLQIEGASGAGKTSLVEAMVGLRDMRGQVWLGGIDVAHVAPDRLRRAFAWLPQDAMLLAGTVRDNLLLACPTASEAQLWEALHDAALDLRIGELPHGLDSWIGENGSRLSGGERRRLALARAYLAPAPWLLLDEPSEGLDAATEALVAERLDRRLDRSGQGLILVSHRPRLAALCNDRVAIGGAPFAAAA